MGVNKVTLNTPNGEEVAMDISNDTVTPETLLDGETAHGADGEGIVGKLKPVLYTPQELTEEEKAQARKNIGAAEGSGTITTDEAYIHENLLEVEKTVIFQNNGEWGDTGYIYTGEDLVPRGGFRFASPYNGVTFTQKDVVTIHLNGTASVGFVQNLVNSSGQWWHPIDPGLAGKTLQIITCSKRILGQQLGLYFTFNDESYTQLSRFSQYVALNAHSTVAQVVVPVGAAYIHCQLTFGAGQVYDNDEIQVHIMEQEKLQSVSLSETNECSGVTDTNLLTFPYKSIITTKLDPAYVRYDKQTLTEEQKAQARENIGVTDIPEVTSSDDGKFLRVVGGVWAAVTVDSAEGVNF